MRVIDDQFHIIPKDYIDAISKRGFGFVGGLKTPPVWNPDRALEVMDTYGIDMAIGCMSEPGVYFDKDTVWAKELARIYNDYCGDLIKKYPDKFRCMGVLPLPSVKDSIEEIDYVFNKLKLSAVCLLTHIDGQYLGHPDFEPVFAELNRQKATVFIHPTLPPEGSRSKLSKPFAPWVMDFVFDTTRCMADLIFAGIPRKYPDIKFVLAHMGGTLPFLAHRLDLYLPGLRESGEELAMGDHDFSYYLQKMYYSVELSYNNAVIDCVESFAGVDHILLGSDFPMAAPFAVEDAQAKLRAHFADNQHKLEKVLHKNIEQVYMNI